MNIAKKNKTEFSEKELIELGTEWRYQVYESQRLWLHRSLLGLIVLSLLLLLSLITNALLFPLKQNVPFLYAVNETTGELSQLGQFKPEVFKQDWLMSRFLIVRYIVNRESYDADNLDRPYQIAWAMSEPPIADSYANDVRTDNPSSPYARYGKHKFITVHVLNVNQLNDKTAEVRFEQTLHDREAGTQETVQKAAIVKWHYSTPLTTEKMLDRDPLGFKIMYYQPTQVNVDK